MAWAGLAQDCICVSAARHEADLTRSAGECFQEHVHFFEGETMLERHGLLAADLPGCTFGQLVSERCARAALAPNESVQQPRALLVVRTDGGTAFPTPPSSHNSGKGK